jgi:DNA polymerase I-like protein with 3'-5' exonuclease and polymerase domains
MAQATLIENSFKELHKRMYEWGQENYNNAVLKGYIESADGWKLHLPEFNNFKSTKEEVENMSNQNWTAYKEGKEESRKYWEAKDKKETYEIIRKISYEYYKKQKPIVSKFFKLKSEYGRLCLNNPIQSSASHMTKYANVLLFNWIKDNNYLGKIKIVNCVHDK